MSDGRPPAPPACARRRSVRRWCAAAARALGIPAGLVVVGMAACADPDGVRVRLEAYTPPPLDARRIEVRAQTAGPLAGLRYRWYSVAGENDPQESDEPVSVFTFADGTTRDRVSVEVWRGDRRVARDEIDVQLDESRLLRASQQMPKLEVTVTTIPPYEAGGPDTRADIAGVVTGPLSPTYRVVIYARADVWYVQPYPGEQHEIGSDGRWASWTHTGSSYAVLVVRPGFFPFPQYDVLPQVGGYVVARTIVEGKRP